MSTQSSLKFWNGTKQLPTMNLNKNGRNDSQSNSHRKFNNLVTHKDILTENTYEDGIAKDMRELELRIESELEEPNKKMTCAEEVIVSPN